MSYGVNQPCGLQAYSYKDMTGFNGSFTMQQLNPNSKPGKIWSGDLVQIVNGYVTPYDPGLVTDAPIALGVFVGCQYQAAGNTVAQKVLYPQMWGGTGVQTQANTPIWAKVIIDENVVYNIQMGNGTAITDDEAQSYTGKSVQYFQANGNDITGNSGSYLQAGTVGTNDNFKLKIMGITPDPNNYLPNQGLVATVYTNFLVKITAAQSVY